MKHSDPKILKEIEVKELDAHIKNLSFNTSDSNVIAYDDLDPDIKKFLDETPAKNTHRKIITDFTLKDKDGNTVDYNSLPEDVKNKLSEYHKNVSGDEIITNPDLKCDDITFADDRKISNPSVERVVSVSGVYQRNDDGTIVEQNMDHYHFNDAGKFVKKPIHEYDTNYKKLDEPIIYYKEDGSELKVHSVPKEKKRIFSYFYCALALIPSFHAVWAAFNHEVFVLYLDQEQDSFSFGYELITQEGYVFPFVYAYIWLSLCLVSIPSLFFYSSSNFRRRPLVRFIERFFVLIMIIPFAYAIYHLYWNYKP